MKKIKTDMMKLTNKTIPDVNRSDSAEGIPQETSNFKSNSDTYEYRTATEGEGFYNPQNVEKANSYLNIQDNADIEEEHNDGYYEQPKGEKRFSTFNAERSGNYNQYNNANDDIQEEEDAEEGGRSYSDKPNSDYYDNNTNNYTLKKTVMPKGPKKSGLSNTGFTHKTEQFNDDISKDFDHSRKPFNYTGFSKNDSEFVINDKNYGYNTGFSRPDQAADNFGSTDNKFRSQRSLSISDNNGNSNNTNTNGFKVKRSSDNTSDNNNNEQRSYHYNYEEMSNNNSDYNPPNFSDREDFNNYINTNSKDFIDSPSDKPLKDEEISIEKNSTFSAVKGKALI